jgi:hypothetical protein
MERPELYCRQPGRFRRWEIGSVIDAEGDFRVMDGGVAADNTRLYVVYRRDPDLREDLQTVLSFLGVNPHPSADTTRAEGGAPPANSTPEAADAIGVALVDPSHGAETRDRPAPTTPPAGELTSGLVRDTLRLPDPLVDQQLVRLPGLFVRWELEPLIEPGVEYHIEPAGRLREGTDLFAVFEKRDSAQTGSSDMQRPER